MDFAGAGEAGGDVIVLVGFGPGASLLESAPGAYAILDQDAIAGSFSAASGLVLGEDVVFIG